MKIPCETCNGTGTVHQYFEIETGVNKWEKVWEDVECEDCNGTGKIEVSTEEYIRQCTTEELVNWLLKYFNPDELIVLWIKYKYPMYKMPDGAKRTDYKEVLRRWLKEKGDE